MKDKLTNDIFAGVKRKYSQIEELNEWSRIVKYGLTPYEEHYIANYIKPEGILLDVGCGGGRECIALDSRKFKVVGIDLLTSMVMNARINATKKNCGIEFSAMNALSLGFLDNTFTGVLMLGQVLTFIPFRENRILALKEAFRVLKPGGKLILTTHSRKCHFKFWLYFTVMDSWRRLQRLFGIRRLEPGDRFASRVGGAKSKGKHYLHMYSMREAYRDLSLAGFKVISCHSRKEIMENNEIPDKRERDYYLIYAAVKI